MYNRSSSAASSAPAAAKQQRDIESFLNGALDAAAQRVRSSGECTPFSVAKGVLGDVTLAEPLPNCDPRQIQLAALYRTLYEHRDEIEEYAVVSQSRCAEGRTALTATYENNSQEALRVVQPYSVDLTQGTYSFDSALVAASVGKVWGG